MKSLTAILVATLLSLSGGAPLAAQEQAQTPDQVPLSLEHRMLLRCSAAFAMVAGGQETGNAEALAYPPMEEAGFEFFMSASAQVMDEAGFDREVLARKLSVEAQALWDEGMLAKIMPACLGMLEAGSQ